MSPTLKCSFTHSFALAHQTMSCLELSYPTCIPLSDYPQPQTESRTKISIISLLNPEPVHPLSTGVDIPSVTSHIPGASVHACRDCSILELSGYERNGHKGHSRRVSKSYRKSKSPYPVQHERARQSRRTSVRFAGNIDNIADKPKRKSSKGVRISLDAHLDNADLEENARRCRAEWLKNQPKRVEVPRPVHHTQPEIKVLALWLADVLCDTFLDEQAGSSGKQLVLQEIAAELRSLMNSCINPPNSMLFLALFYMRKLFSNRLNLRAFSDLHRAQVVFRAFCLSLMFAFKWLDDYTHSVGSCIPDANEEFWRVKRADPKKYRTCWADFMAMSVTEIQTAELCALKMLDWNISVSAPDWYFWLEDLRLHTHAQSTKSGYTTVAMLISAAQLELRRNSPDAPFMSLRQHAFTSSPENLRRLERALLVGISVVPCTILPRNPLEECSIIHTAELRPFEDEIVHRPPPTKSVGYAPGNHLATYQWNLEGCSPRSQNTDFRAKDDNPFAVITQNPLPSHSTLTPIFLNPWHVYDFKSSVYL
ncbi:hypothetical protein F5890DRAFT_450914 [Lentinula detonsa]|uniref:Uncharacterized protein n=1 Tax=Lentinula detonsa TaxID=2804962 RepID=A0AA38QAW5_9AGAR|nr:hypothetical protein F5890DRAFT_450914 [Lentinula detonsa]